MIGSGPGGWMQNGVGCGVTGLAVGAGVGVLDAVGVGVGSQHTGVLVGCAVGVTVGAGVAGVGVAQRSGITRQQASGLAAQ